MSDLVNEPTDAMYIAAPQLEVGMLVSPFVNEPLCVIEDIAPLDGDGDLRITLSQPGRGTRAVRYRETDLMEVHVELDEAVAEFHRLSAAETEALDKAYAIGLRRADMARLARSLGWRG